MMTVEFGTPWRSTLTAQLVPDAAAGFTLAVQHNGVNIGGITVSADTLHGQRAAEAFVRTLLDSTGLRFRAARIDVTPGVIHVITHNDEEK